MPIPDLPVFQTFLGSLQLTRQDGIGYSSEIAIPATAAEDVSSKIVEPQCILLQSRAHRILQSSDKTNESPTNVRKLVHEIVDGEIIFGLER